MPLKKLWAFFSKWRQPKRRRSVKEVIEATPEVDALEGAWVKWLGRKRGEPKYAAWKRRKGSVEFRAWPLSSNVRMHSHPGGVVQPSSNDLFRAGVYLSDSKKHQMFTIVVMDGKEVAGYTCIKRGKNFRPDLATSGHRSVRDIADAERHCSYCGMKIKYFPVSGYRVERTEDNIKFVKKKKVS